MLTSEDKRLITLMRDALTAALADRPASMIDYAKAADGDVPRAADKLYLEILASPCGLSKEALARKHPTWGRLRFAATDLLINTNRIVATVSNGRGRPATIYTANPTQTQTQGNHDHVDRTA